MKRRGQSVDGPQVRKKAHRNAIVTMVDELEATLADCANRILETDGVLLGGELDLQWISGRLDVVRSQLAMVATKNTDFHDAHLPSIRGMQPAMRWLAIHCLRFVAVQTSALSGIVDVLTVTSGAEGEDLEYLRRTVQYFEAVYEEHRKLTALALSGDDDAGSALDALHLTDVNRGIANFCRQVEEFEEFRRTSPLSSSLRPGFPTDRSDQFIH